MGVVLGQLQVVCSKSISTQLQVVGELLWGEMLGISVWNRGFLQSHSCDCSVADTSSSRAAPPQCPRSIPRVATGKPAGKPAPALIKNLPKKAYKVYGRVIQYVGKYFAKDVERGRGPVGRAEPGWPKCPALPSWAESICLAEKSRSKQAALIGLPDTGEQCGSIIITAQRGYHRRMGLVGVSQTFSGYQSLLPTCLLLQLLPHLHLPQPEEMVLGGKFNIQSENIVPMLLLRKLQERLINAPALALPGPEEELELYVDVKQGYAKGIL
ncbi:hypothetical protein IHE44_0006422, partial [Lamprotornis superbus]